MSDKDKTADAVAFALRQIDELAQRVKDLEQRVRDLERESNASVTDFADDPTPVNAHPQYVCAVCGRPAGGTWIKSRVGPLCPECGETFKG